MAPARKKSKGAALWREAWEATPHSGMVELSAAEDRLVIRCDTVSAEYGKDAEILDDGRTVTVAPGDHVAFGVIARDGLAPVAVNVWRAPLKKKKRKAREALEQDMVEDSGFDFSSWAGPEGEKRRRREALPEALAGELLAVIRNQSASSGNYWLESEEVFAEYQRDACVLFHTMPRGIGVGDAIYFEVSAPQNDYASPLAENIRKATGDAAEALMLKFKRKGKGKGKGKGKAERQWKSQSKALKSSTMRMLGVVKKKSTNTGRHFVLCQDISDVYGVDAQIPVEEMPEGVEVGDRISFDADEPPEGVQGIPLARNVRKVSARAGQKRPVKEDDDYEDEDEDAGDEEYADGEDDFGEAEGEEVEAAEEDPEEPAVGEEEIAELEAADRLESEVLGDEEGGDEPEAKVNKEVKPARQRPRKAREPEAVEEPAADEEADVEDPETLDGWVKMQDIIFKGMKPLKKGWIRIRSKSRGGLVYYYNRDTGESTSKAPLR